MKRCRDDFFSLGATYLPPASSVCYGIEWEIEGSSGGTSERAPGIVIVALQGLERADYMGADCPRIQWYTR